MNPKKTTKKSSELKFWLAIVAGGVVVLLLLLPFLMVRGVEVKENLYILHVSETELTLLSYECKEDLENFDQTNFLIQLEEAKSFLDSSGKALLKLQLFEAFLEKVRYEIEGIKIYLHVINKVKEALLSVVVCIISAVTVEGSMWIVSRTFHICRQLISRLTSCHIFDRRNVDDDNKDTTSKAQNDAMSVQTKPPLPTPNVIPIVSRIQKDKDSIFHASLYGHEKMIRLILAETDTEVDIAKLDSVSGNSAFHLASASASGHLSIVHQMMNKFGSLYCLALINNDGRTTLELAAENGRQEVVHELLRVLRRKHLRDSKWSVVMKSALVLSIQTDNVEIMKIIFKKLSNYNLRPITIEPNLEILLEQFYQNCKLLKAFKSAGRSSKERNWIEAMTRDKEMNKIEIIRLLQAKQEGEAPVEPEFEVDFQCLASYKMNLPQSRIFVRYEGHRLCNVCLAIVGTKINLGCRDDLSVRSFEAEDKMKQNI